MKALEKTAYHEAGHIVAAYLMGHELTSVTIIPSENALGVAKSHPFTDDFDVEKFSLYDIKDYNLLFKLLVSSCAGQVAAHIASGRKDKIGCYDDYEQVTELMFKFNLDDEMIKSLYKSSEIYTRQILEYQEVWELVESIAKKLLVKKELNHDDIFSIIEESVLFGFLSK
jgi:ATP-dependent Zn protease